MKHRKKVVAGGPTLAKGVSMVKKFIALFVSTIFAFSLGIAYAEEEKVQNPWERDMLISTKKEDKTKKQAKKIDKSKDRKSGAERVKRAKSDKVEKASVAKNDKKETGQKKRFLFW